MTYAPKAISAVYEHLEKVYASADRRSGIAADKPGYHNCRNELRRDGRTEDYSIQLDVDRLGDGDAASALDCKFDTADMIKVSKRMMAASKAGDPRLKGKVREWFGTVDGRTVTGFNLYRDRVADSDSTHLWHLHISGHRKFANDAAVWLGIAEVACGLPPGTLSKPNYLPVYLVDPAKVSTTLTANAPAGKEDLQRKPLYEITTGVKIVDEGGHRWLVTAADYSYRLDHLILKSEYEKQEPAKPTEPTLTKIRVASYNVLSDAAGIAGGEGPFAKRLPAIIASLRTSKASILLLQECNGDRAKDIQGVLGAEWVWSRVGSRTIMTDTRVWTVTEEREVEVPAPHAGTPKGFPLVRLAHKITGEIVWAYPLHLSATGPFLDADTDRDDMAAERAWQTHTVVVATGGIGRCVGGGDLNSSSTSVGKPKELLKRAGFSLLTQHPTFDSKAVDSFPNKTAGGQQIDDVWCKGLTILDGRIIEGKGSDHNLLVAELAVNPPKAD